MPILCTLLSLTKQRNVHISKAVNSYVCPETDPSAHGMRFWHPQGHMAVRLGVREDLIWIKHLLTQRMEHKCLKSKCLNTWWSFITDHQWRFIAGSKPQTWFVRQNQQFLGRLDRREKHSQCYRDSFKFVVTRGQLFKTSFTEKFSLCLILNIQMQNMWYMVCYYC